MTEVSDNNEYTNPYCDGSIEGTTQVIALHAREELVEVRKVLQKYAFKPKVAAA